MVNSDCQRFVPNRNAMGEGPQGSLKGHVLITANRRKGVLIVGANEFLSYCGTAP